MNIGDLKGNTSDENPNGRMVSFNHYANGAACDWLYRRITGIEAISAGYQTFDVKSHIGG